jgi:glucokinase
MSEYTIGIDLGGTRIKAVAIDSEGKIMKQHYQPTNDGDESIWKNAIAKSIEELKLDIPHDDVLIGISAPGLPNEDNTAIAFMPGRLDGLEGFIWSNFLNHKTYVINDALAAMQAEAKFGAAKNRKNVVMLTLGTGVGGAVLIDGKLHQGLSNKAGHLGHIVIDSDGEQDIFGIPGSLEDAIGNCTIEKRSNGKYNATSEVIKAMEAGDEFAKNIWLTSVRKLAVGLASITNIISPELIILGGGITEAGHYLFDPLNEYMAIYEFRPNGEKAEIVKAQFGDLSGAVGAASVAMQELKMKN